MLFFNPDEVLDLVSSGSSKRAEGQPGGRLEDGTLQSSAHQQESYNVSIQDRLKHQTLESLPSLLPHRSGVTPSYRIVGAQGAWPLLTGAGSD